MICRQGRKEFSQYRDSHVYAVSKSNSHSWGLCAVPMTVPPSQLQTYASLFSFVMLGWDPANPCWAQEGCKPGRRRRDLKLLSAYGFSEQHPSNFLYPGGAVSSCSSSWSWIQLFTHLKRQFHCFWPLPASQQPPQRPGSQAHGDTPLSYGFSYPRYSPCLSSLRGSSYFLCEIMEFSLDFHIVNSTLYLVLSFQVIVVVLSLQWLLTDIPLPFKTTILKLQCSPRQYL